MPKFRSQVTHCYQVTVNNHDFVTRTQTLPAIKPHRKHTLFFTFLLLLLRLVLKILMQLLLRLLLLLLVRLLMRLSLRLSAYEGHEGYSYRELKSFSSIMAETCGERGLLVKVRSLIFINYERHISFSFFLLLLLRLLVRLLMQLLLRLLLRLLV